MSHFMAKDTIVFRRTQEGYTNFTSSIVGSSMIQRVETEELHFCLFKKCWIFCLAIVYP